MTNHQQSLPDNFVHTETPCYTLLDDLPHTETDQYDAAHIAETRHVLESQLQKLVSVNNAETREHCFAARLGRCLKTLGYCKKLADWQYFYRDLKVLFHYERQSRTAIRIGLFGGLGQGKTSALIQATNTLNKSSCCWFEIDKSKRARAHWFDAAHYKPDQMEYEFDRIFKSWGWVSQLFFAVFCIVSIGLFYYVTHALENVSSTDSVDLAKTVSSILRILVPVIVGCIGLKFLGIWLRDTERALTFPNQHSTWTRLFCKPDIFIVDNLDRANIAQQIAILRALYKYSQSLPIVFVVCMDESALLQANASPEQPASLLRKVINVELRLPARLPQDAPLLCQAILDECQNKNPGLAIVSDPLFAGDFATLVSLIPDFSPRIAKRLLNDALLDGQKNRLLHSAEDCGALLRLHLLYAAFPGLQHYSLPLINILECKEEQKKNLKIADLAKASGHDKNRLHEMITRSQSVQPLAGNWKRLIGVHAEVNTHIETTGRYSSVSKVKQGISDQETARKLWESLTAIQLGYGSSELLTLKTRELDQQFPFMVWPTLAVLLTQSQSPNERLRLLRYFSDLLGASTKTGDTYPQLYYAFFRYWLGDYQVIAIMPEPEQDSLVNRIKQLSDHRRIYLLPIFNPHDVRFGDVFELLFDHPSKDHRVIRDWFNQVALPATKMRDFSGPSVRGEYLAAIWPTLSADCLASGWISQLETHFRLFRTLNDLSLLEIAPNSLVSSLFTEGNWQRMVEGGKASLLLRSLTILLRLENRWSLKTWKILTSVLQSTAEKHAMVVMLIEQANYNSTSLWPVALLLANDVNDPLSVENVLKSSGVLESIELVKLLIQLPGSCLWTQATKAQIKQLLDNLVSPSEGEWATIKDDYSQDLLSCFTQHPEQRALVEHFNLEIF